MDAHDDPFTERVALELEKLVAGLNAERGLVSHWMDEHAKGCSDEVEAARRILDGASLEEIMRLHNLSNVVDILES